ncbi:MAG: hypothetical protein IKO26_05925 [Paludibacteraceae bacterium]|nr:hypothetical protein [Paludibacteraceae bacterium]
MNWKKIFMAVLAVAVLSMSGCMPGSDQWNIRRAARCYVKEGGLQEGEKLVFVNGIQRKCGCEWQDKSCKYAAVKYTVRDANGNKQQRMIHLLMDERCKRVIDCSYDGKAEWAHADGLLLLFNYINQ